MQCPECGEQTRVLESRRADAGDAVRRRRRCSGCDRRFTTFERRAHEPLTVVKRNGERHGFDRAKLRAALGRAAHKRGISAELDKLVARIEFEVERSGGEVSSDAIRQMCLDGLRELDPNGAFLQFAGVDGLSPANTELASVAVRPSPRASSATPRNRMRGAI